MVCQLFKLVFGKRESIYIMAFAQFQQNASLPLLLWHRGRRHQLGPVEVRDKAPELVCRQGLDDEPFGSGVLVMHSRSAAAVAASVVKLDGPDPSVHQQARSQAVARVSGRSMTKANF